MQTHQLKRRTPNHKSAPVGRGGRRGKTSGRGTKGQKARAGHKIRPEIRDVIKRLPKLRGYSFNSIETKPVIVDLGTISKIFKANSEISPATLAEHKVISKRGKAYPRVKILSDGDISIKVIVKDCAISAKAKEKIEKAGGKIG